MNRTTNRCFIPQFAFWIVLLSLGWMGSTFAIDVNPSKYQGGTTNANANPYKTEGAPSLFKSPFKWIFGSGHSAAMERIKAPPNFKVSLSTLPTNFVATNNAVLKARMVVVNKGTEKYILEFESAQHYDFIILNQDSKEVYRYSGDKSFSQQLSSTVLNPNEKLVYEDDLFAPGSPITQLPAGKYKLIGRVTAKAPISVETSFQVAP